MQQTQSPKAGKRTQIDSWQLSREQPARYADGGTSRMIYTDTQRRYLVAEIYGKSPAETDARARLAAAAPNMAKFIRELCDMTDIRRSLNAGIMRQMQDLLTEAGLTK